MGVEFIAIAVVMGCSLAALFVRLEKRKMQPTNIESDPHSSTDHDLLHDWDKLSYAEQTKRLVVDQRRMLGRAAIRE